MDHIFATILSALETDHESIHIKPARTHTRLVAYTGGLSVTDNEETTLEAPLANLEVPLYELLLLNGWSIRSDKRGGYIARRNNTITALAA